MKKYKIVELYNCQCIVHRTHNSSTFSGLPIKFNEFELQNLKISNTNKKKLLNLKSGNYIKIIKINANLHEVIILDGDTKNINKKLKQNQEKMQIEYLKKSILDKINEYQKLTGKKIEKIVDL